MVTDAQADGTGQPTLTNPAGQYNFLTGGNPALKPEISDTWSFGVVLTPTFLPGFSGSVDWFDIKVESAIQVLDPNSIIDDCYDGGNLSSCARITRSSAGFLWTGGGNIADLAANIGGLRTRGIDVNAYYRTEIAEGWGAISFNLVGTWLDTLQTDTGLPTVGTIECAGKFSGNCGIPNPEWRHRFRVAWEVPVEDWNPVVSFTWRRFSEVENDFGANQPLDGKFDAQNYFDIGLTADIMKGTSFRFGINNVFDKEPPLTDNTGTTGNGNTYPQTYDAFGRYVFAGVTINL
jgi:outer membrane receptor protein involved in Fe transport